MGVSRPVVIKGGGLQHLYESPALRQMSDLDIAVMPREWPARRRALLDLGWREDQQDGGTVFVEGSSRILLDPHVAQTPGARAIIQRAKPCPELAQGAFVPDVPDHVMLVAVHAANNGGARLWRDVCDVQALLAASPEKPAVVLTRARERCPAPDDRDAVTAMARVLGAWGCVDVEAYLGACEVEEGRALPRLYRAMAVECASPAALDLVRMTQRPLSDHLRRILSKRSSRKDTGAPGSGGRWAERDPVLGTLPGAGSRERQWLRLRLLARFLLSGHWRRYQSVFRLQQSVVGRAKVFTAAGADPGKPTTQRKKKDRS
jgi:hypothetical protein